MGFALLWAVKVAARWRLEIFPEKKKTPSESQIEKTLETIVFSYIKYKVIQYNKDNRNSKFK